MNSSTKKHSRQRTAQPPVERLEIRTLMSAFGDVQVLATVPAPGFPEGIAVRGDRVYVAGPATFGTAGHIPSKVFAYDDRTGALLRTYDIQGENLSQEHANSRDAWFSPFTKNLVKPLRSRFWNYVVDSVGEIKLAKVTVIPFAV